MAFIRLTGLCLLPEWGVAHLLISWHVSLRQGLTRWPGIWYINQADLRLRVPLAFASWVLGSKVCNPGKSRDTEWSLFIWFLASFTLSL